MMSFGRRQLSLPVDPFRDCVMSCQLKQRPFPPENQMIA